MRAPRRQPIGRPLRPNVGIEVSYRKKLNTLLDQMERSIIFWICKKPAAPVMAADENRATALRNILRALTKRWSSRFDDAAKDIAEWFARQVMAHSALAMRKTLEAGKIPTVEFKMSPAARDAFNAVVTENVGLIKSIASQHLTAVTGLVMRAVSVGRDLGPMAKALEAQFGVTKRRAALIARHQNNMASAVITRVRQQEAGITEAVWEHSSAGRHPRPEHVAFSGKTYDVKTGAFLEGKWIWPGTEINCRCYSRPVLPGF